MVKLIETTNRESSYQIEIMEEELKSATSSAIVRHWDDSKWTNNTNLYSWRKKARAGNAWTYQFASTQNHLL